MPRTNRSRRSQKAQKAQKAQKGGFTFDESPPMPQQQPEPQPQPVRISMSPSNRNLFANSPRPSLTGAEAPTTQPAANPEGVLRSALEEQAQRCRELVEDFQTLPESLKARLLPQYRTMSGCPELKDLRLGGGRKKRISKRTKTKTTKKSPKRASKRKSATCGKRKAP